MSARRGLMQMGAAAQDEYLKLVAELDIVVPEQTSSSQSWWVTIPEPFTGHAPYVPYLALLEYTDPYPTAPENTSIVKVWQLLAAHANSGSYIYDIGCWPTLVNTSGNVTYVGSSFSSHERFRIDAVQDEQIRLLLQATASGKYAVAPGNWHVRLYQLKK